MERPDLIRAGEDKLSFVERAQVGLIRGTLEPGWFDVGIRTVQRLLHAHALDRAMSPVMNVHGLDRLPEFDRAKSYLCVANHRTFFDMFVIVSRLMARGHLRHRIMFPVRAPFFYDHFLGAIVNGLSSGFAMYPPIFRDRSRAALNVASLDEVAWLLQRGGVFCGIHPEGTRNQGEDPYALLPMQRGIGKVIHESKTTVIPAFVNGLGPNLWNDIADGWRGRGRPVWIVFGEPIDFTSELARSGGMKLHKAIAERTGEAIARLGQEEKQLRAAAEGSRATD